MTVGGGFSLSSTSGYGWHCGVTGAITSVPLQWHGRALSGFDPTDILPISDGDPPLKVMTDPESLGVSMRLMHLCYAALGYAVARWVFRRQPVADPVSRLRSSGLL